MAALLLQLFICLVALFAIWLAIFETPLEITSTPHQKLQVHIIPHSHYDPGLFSDKIVNVLILIFYN